MLDCYVLRISLIRIRTRTCCECLAFQLPSFAAILRASLACSHNFGRPYSPARRGDFEWLSECLGSGHAVCVQNAPNIMVHEIFIQAAG